jgi:putative membrane protein
MVSKEEIIMTRRISIILLSLYAVVTAFTSARALLGLAPILFLVPLTTLVGFGFALVHAIGREGWKRALILLALVFVVSLTFESVGVATGLVYGPYHYTNKLGPLFLGLVPYLIPVAWFMMSYPSFVIADRLVPAGWKRWARLVGVAAVGGLVMTAWDVVMDPIMVAGGHWIWDVNGAYHGIPLQNYWGWWLTVFSTYALYLWIVKRPTGQAQAAFDRLAVFSYLTSALGLVLSCAVTGAGELALLGIFAMFPWVIAGGLTTASR